MNKNKGFVWGALILLALAAFEIFNFSTTQYALKDLLGLSAWPTILAFAFCGIDFAGIARLFTPGEDCDQPDHAWHLYGAWLMASALNAVLVWWGISVAVANNNSAGSVIISNDALHVGVPIFVAAVIWLIRILIIGTITFAGNRSASGSKLPVRRYPPDDPFKYAGRHAPRLEPPSRKP